MEALTGSLPLVALAEDQTGMGKGPQAWLAKETMVVKVAGRANLLRILDGPVEVEVEPQELEKPLVFKAVVLVETVLLSRSVTAQISRLLEAAAQVNKVADWVAYMVAVMADELEVEQMEPHGVAVEGEVVSTMRIGVSREAMG